jgi:hypothetical protein
MCDNALLSGFAAGRQPVGRDIVAEVIRDFDFAPRAVEPEELRTVMKPDSILAPTPIVLDGDQERVETGSEGDEDSSESTTHKFGGGRLSKFR